MSPEQLLHFRQILEKQRDQLSEINRAVHVMQEDATIFADPNDRASQESDMTLELRNRDRERKLIKKLMKQLLKLMQMNMVIVKNAAWTLVCNGLRPDPRLHFALIAKL